MVAPDPAESMVKLVGLTEQVGAPGPGQAALRVKVVFARLVLDTRNAPGLAGLTRSQRKGEAVRSHRPCRANNGLLVRSGHGRAIRGRWVDGQRDCPGANGPRGERGGNGYGGISRHEIQR